KLANHSRNLDDEQLLALKKNGGVMQTVAFASYVKVASDSPERTAALDALRKEFSLPEGTPLGGGGRGAGRAAGAAPNPCGRARGDGGGGGRRAGTRRGARRWWRACRTRRWRRRRPRQRAGRAQ